LTNLTLGIADRPSRNASRAHRREGRGHGHEPGRQPLVRSLAAGQEVVLPGRLSAPPRRHAGDAQV